ncbi:MAG TPA: thermonuclease family protein [Gaiellaceae bacterium]|nr:thermonuclease family protein [Gaiellaceae bacterium]
MRCALSVLAATIAAAVLIGVPVASSSGPAKVRSVYDGDTLTLTDGQRVRLLQVDTPELGSGECYSRAAHRVLLSLVPPGTAVTLDTDPALDRVDRYGRLLRYVLHGGLNVNLELVRRGAAAPYFYVGERGRYAPALMRAAQSAKAAKRGLWGACPRTLLDPDRAVDTGISGPPAKAHTITPVASPGSNCAPSYPTVCIPPPPPDLDCKDVPDRHFTVRWDVPDPDPHHFDGNHDGLGCES